MKNLLTVKDVAERFKVTPLTVRRWVYSKKIKAYKLAHMLFFVEEDLTEQLEKYRGK